MEKRAPFFLTRLFRRSPQDSEFGEQKGWGDTTDDTKFGGWGSSPGPTSSGAITNGWADEPPDSHYNGWGTGIGTDTDTDTVTVTDAGIDTDSLHRPPTPKTTSKEYNGWGCSPHGKSATPEASSNELPESELASKKSRLINAESFPCPAIPSAPPLPDKGFNEHHDGNYTLDHLGFDIVKKEVVSMNQSKNGDARCVVCWDAPVEGACVPCGHMASCMACLREIESKQGTCPVCRAKIDKVMRIYAISTE